MKTRTRTSWAGQSGGLALLALAGLLLPFSFNGFSETLGQSEVTLPQESSFAPVEFREEPVLGAGKISLAPALVRKVLENFLAHVSILAKVTETDLDDEYRILYYTVLPFLASRQFEKVVLRAQRERHPIELVLISPRRLREAKMVEEFSGRFHLPLDYEPNQEIIPSTVTISLAVPWYGIPIKIESAGKESLYLVDSERGSIVKRYARSDNDEK